MRQAGVVACGCCVREAEARVCSVAVWACFVWGWVWKCAREVGGWSAGEKKQGLTKLLRVSPKLLRLASILLSQPPKRWDYRRAPPRQADRRGAMRTLQLSTRDATARPPDRSAAPPAGAPAQPPAPPTQHRPRRGAARRPQGSRALPGRAASQPNTSTHTAQAGCAVLCCAGRPTTNTSSALLLFCAAADSVQGHSVPLWLSLWLSLSSFCFVLCFVFLVFHCNHRGLNPGPQFLKPASATW